MPWKYRYETDFVRVDDAGRLCLQDLEDKLKSYKGRVGLVAVTGASNVTGYTNDVHKIARLAHKYGAKILVDGAQLIPHCSFDMKPKEEDEHIDFLAFSAHKMYAPFGSGVLIAPKDIFKDGHSEIIGGGTIDFVSMEDTIWLNPPQKEEAGTPNLMGVVALMEAIKILESIGMERIEEYERNLTIYALNLMREIPNLIIYDDFNTDAKVSIISFNIEGMHHSILAELLGKEGIGVRNGCFCAQPYVQQILKISDEEMEKYKDKLLPRPGLVRMSLGLYNSYEEVYRMAEVLDTIGRNVDYYLECGRYILWRKIL